METLNCFTNDVRSGRIDKESYRFGHKLLNHPALSMENLAQVIPSLPKDCVMYSKGLLTEADNFETTFRERPRDRSIEETIEQIRVTDSYVMVRSPEAHPSFRDLHRQLLADVETLMREAGVGDRAVEPRLYLFIASPRSITPFHVDRYSTFLLQFRGSKQVTIFPQWDDRVVPAKDLEDYVCYQDTKLNWAPELDSLARSYEFQPGQALHIPFAAGHHVRNGSEDVSISMSIIFNTKESMMWRNALQFNRMARRRLGPIASGVQNVGTSPFRDAAKSRAWTTLNGLRRLAGRR